MATDNDYKKSGAVGREERQKKKEKKKGVYVQWTIETISLNHWFPYKSRVNMCFHIVPLPQLVVSL